MTDSGSEIVRAADKPGVTNLIDILAVARGVTPEAVEEEMRSARGYGDLKAATAQAVVDMLAPLRERYAELRGDEERLEAILAEGAEKARAMARETLADVREAMGFGPARLARPCAGSACSSAPSSSSTRCSTRRSRRCCRPRRRAATSARTAPACWPAPMPPGTLIGALPGGWLAARAGVKAHGARRPALMSFSGLAFAFGSSIVVVDLARFMQGVGGACSWAGGMAWVAGEAPRERRGEVIGGVLGAASSACCSARWWARWPRDRARGGLLDQVLFGVALGAWAMRCRAAALGGLRAGGALRQRSMLPACGCRAAAAAFGVLDVLAPLRLDALGRQRPCAGRDVLRRRRRRGGHRAGGGAGPRIAPRCAARRAHRAGHRRRGARRAAAAGQGVGACGRRRLRRRPARRAAGAGRVAAHRRGGAHRPRRRLCLRLLQPRRGRAASRVGAAGGGALAQVARTPSRTCCSRPRTPCRWRWRPSPAAALAAVCRRVARSPGRGDRTLATVSRVAPVPIADLDLDLEVFYGPFDLLLTLVLKEEIDLIEVDLAEVVAQLPRPPRAGAVSSTSRRPPSSWY